MLSAARAGRRSHRAASQSPESFAKGKKLRLVGFQVFHTSRGSPPLPPPPPPPVCALYPSNPNQRRLISGTKGASQRGPAGRLTNGELSCVAVFLLSARSPRLFCLCVLSSWKRTKKDPRCCLCEALRKWMFLAGENSLSSTEGRDERRESRRVSDLVSQTLVFLHTD